MSCSGRSLHRCLIFVYCALFSAACHSQLFEDVTQSAGTFHFGETWGASWGDLNGDALPDLFAGNHRQKPAMYRNNGDGTFSNVVDLVDSSGTWTDNPIFDLHGAAWTDFDGDGDQDLAVTTGVCCPAQLFVNNNGILTDETATRGIVDDGGGRMPFMFDYDRDGLIDMALMNSGTSKLLRQDLSGNFSQVGVGQSEFRCTGFRSNYSQLSDLDNDLDSGGNMEVMCMRDGVSPARAYETSSVPFMDITADLPSEGAVIDTIIADLDGNLLPDIFMVRGGLRHNQFIKADADYIEGRIQTSNGGQRELRFSASGILTVEFSSTTVANQGNPNKIFIGAGGFHPATADLFTLDPDDPQYQGIQPHTPGTDHGLYLGYDTSVNEWVIQLSSRDTSTRGYLEITAATSIGEPVLTPMLAVDLPFESRLYMNHGIAGYTEESDTRGFAQKISCVSGVAVDVDNDGDKDLYFVCRGGAENLPNRLYLNDGSGNFTEVPNAGGAQGITGVAIYDSAGVGDSVVAADYDVDGFIDLFTTNGLNLQPIRSDGGPDQLFHNLGNGNNWIQVDLVGTTSNADAIGAKVYADTSGTIQLSEQNGGYHRWSQNSQRIHFGLGTHLLVDLEVHWPNGTVEEYGDVDANALYRITQGVGIEEVTIGSPPPLPDEECGEPSYGPGLEKAVYIWKDCVGGGGWSLRTTGGGDPNKSVYEVSVTSVPDFSSATTFSFEANDVLNFSGGLIEATMNMRNAGSDGIDFTFPAGADTCFDATVLPAGATVRLGGNRALVTPPFNLDTRESCSPPPPPPVEQECGQPTYSPGVDKGLFLWKDCSASGHWYIRTTGGGDPNKITYMATMSSDTGFSSVSEFSFESNDILTVLGNQVDTTMNMRGAGSDGVDFDFIPGSDTCFEATVLPAGAQVFLGADRQVMAGPFDLETQALCSVPPPPPSEPECGQPSYDSGSEKAVLVWKDCGGSDDWHVRMTGGGDPDQTRYEGTVTSTGPFSGITPFSIEGHDEFDTSNPLVISYVLKMWNASEDGFGFSFPDIESACFDVTGLPAGAQVLLGSGRLPVPARFDLDDQTGC